MFSMTSLNICRFFQLTSPCKKSPHYKMRETSGAAADLHGVRVALVDERDVTEVPGDKITNIHGKTLGETTTHMPRNGTMGGGALL